MDATTARTLLTQTLDEARWKNEDGVLMLWQMSYEMPLVPDATPQVNRRIEKLVERVGFTPKDFTDPGQQERRLDVTLRELGDLGVVLDAGASGC